MKRTILLTGFLFVLLFANATIRTVSNNPTTVAQDSTINAAINHVANGDTILVQGSPVIYPSFTLSGKKVTIIGPGWSPVILNVLKGSLTAKVASGSYLTVGSGGTEIQGLEFSAGNALIIDNTVSINNLRLIRNHFNGDIRIGTDGTAITYSGYIFEGNWFENMKILGDYNCIYHDFLVQNNFLYNIRIARFTNQNNLNFLINHNTFYNGAPFFNDDEDGVYTRNLTITNNIFYNTDLTLAIHYLSCQCTYFSVGYSVFQNNITYSGNTTAPWTLNANTNGGGNSNNTDPQIANLATIGNNPLANFTVQGGPAYNGGLDGKNMGLLFDATGSLNWTNSKMSRIPYIYSFSITNPNIGPGGSVQINLEARRNN